jgi:hypothetical protein
MTAMTRAVDLAMGFMTCAPVTPLAITPEGRPDFLELLET